MKTLIAISLILACTGSHASLLRLVDTIDVSQYGQISSISSTGSELLLLSSKRTGIETTGSIISIDSDGNEINSRQVSAAPGNTVSVGASIAYVDGQIVYGTRTPMTSITRLAVYDPNTDTISGPFGDDIRSIAGIGYDGSDLFKIRSGVVRNNVFNATVDILDSVSFANTGSFSLIANTPINTNMVGVTVYGLGFNADNLFITVNTGVGSGLKGVLQFDKDFNFIGQVVSLNICASCGIGGLGFIGDDLFVNDFNNKIIRRYSTTGTKITDPFNRRASVSEPKLIYLLFLSALAIFLTKTVFVNRNNAPNHN